MCLIGENYERRLSKTCPDPLCVLQRDKREETLPLLVLVHGAVGGGEDVSLCDEGAPAPELPPTPAVQVDGRHPGHLAFKRLVAAHNPPLGHLHTATR